MSTVTHLRQKPTRGEAALTPKSVLARLDRIDAWSMPFLFLGIIGTGFLFAFYDVFDINVSFIQTCVALKHGCTPENAITTLRVPVVLNLLGYVIGALILAPISDRIGRRNMLLFTMGLTGLGALYSAVAPNYTHFVLSRIVTGIGVGADLAIVNTFVGEVSPRRNRSRWISVIFIMSSLGALLGIWLGLVLTTESAAWPNGISFAQASPTFTNGWRWMYAIGALLAVIGIALRVKLPESPRWLVGRGRLDEADEVVTEMERVASKHGPLAPVDDDVPVDAESTRGTPFANVLKNRVYLIRVVQLLAVWFLAYVTVFGFSAGLTSILASLKYPPPEAGLITAVGAFGFLACAVFAVAFSERLERKLWLPIGAVITLIGGVIVAAAGTGHLLWAFIGAGVVFFGFNIWVPMTYTLSTESFPTRARATGFGMVDGVGHLGGGIGVLVIAPLIPHLSVLGAFMLITAFLVAAAVVAQFTLKTRGRRYEEISP
jgi:MFS transporter, putative metabolite:H+ symporter